MILNIFSFHFWSNAKIIHIRALINTCQIYEVLLDKWHERTRRILYFTTRHLTRLQQRRTSRNQTDHSSRLTSAADQMIPLFYRRAHAHVRYSVGSLAICETTDSLMNRFFKALKRKPRNQETFCINNVSIWQKLAERIFYNNIVTIFENINDNTTKCWCLNLWIGRLMDRHL